MGSKIWYEFQTIWGHLVSVPSFKMDALLAAIFEFTMDYTEISVSKVGFFLMLDI